MSVSVERTMRHPLWTISTGPQPCVRAATTGALLNGRYSGSPALLATTHSMRSPPAAPFRPTFVRASSVASAIDHAQRWARHRITSVHGLNACGPKMRDQKPSFELKMGQKHRALSTGLHLVTRLSLS